MSFLICCCLVTGVYPLTFNGETSSANATVTSVNSTKISFIVRTRQSLGFILAFYKNIEEYFAVGIKDGMIYVQSKNRSASEINHLGGLVNDGTSVQVSIENNSENETVIFSANDTVNNTVLTEKYLMPPSWANLVNSVTLSVGKAPSASGVLFAGPFLGCISLVKIGDVEQNLIHVNTKPGCAINSQCSASSCVNGICKDVFNDYECRCMLGWSGKACDKNINDCLPNPCSHNGTCSDKVNDYECTCFEGRYKGKNCTDDVNECQNNICENAGSCNNTIGSFECTCLGQYFGDKCQYNNTMLCEKKNPCKHGTCVDDSNGANCTCNDGYTGKWCDQDFNECEVLKPCQNNGTCSDSHTRAIPPIEVGFKCVCIGGFTGKTCALKEDDDNINLIIGVTVAVVVVIIIIVIILIIRFCKDKSGMEGTYSPNREEQQTGQVEMNTLKKPNTERLI